MWYIIGLCVIVNVGHHRPVCRSYHFRRHKTESAATFTNVRHELFLTEYSVFYSSEGNKFKCAVR